MYSQKSLETPVRRRICKENLRPTRVSKAARWNQSTPGKIVSPAPPLIDSEVSRTLARSLGDPARDSGDSMFQHTGFPDSTSHRQPGTGLCNFHVRVPSSATSNGHPRPGTRFRRDHVPEQGPEPATPDTTQPPIELPMTAQPPPRPNHRTIRIHSPRQVHAVKHSI